MKIRFTRDFDGELSYMHHFDAGDMVVVPDELGQHLIDKGRAVEANTGRGRPEIQPPVISSMKPVDVGDDWTAEQHRARLNAPGGDEPDTDAMIAGMVDEPDITLPGPPDDSAPKKRPWRK